MIPAMTYSRQGLELTEHFEDANGPALKAFFDVFAKIWTIGYGHTGTDVKEGLVWTLEQCINALARDVVWAEWIVNQFVEVTLTQDQFDACVDFTFNAGSGAFEDSTLLKYINAGSMIAADNEFTKWVYSGKSVVPGLVRRRAAEEKIFSTT